jgi:hypothetical protein
MQPESSLVCPQEPVTCPIVNQMNQFRTVPSNSFVPSLHKVKLIYYMFVVFHCHLFLLILLLLLHCFSSYGLFISQTFLPISVFPQLLLFSFPAKHLF